MSIPDVTLLFQDLLSPSTTLLASTTPALITYHLSTLPLTSSSTQLVTPLLRYLVTSPALWRGQAQQQSSASASQIWEPLNWSRGKEVYDAIRNGILYRVGEISKELGTGWRARRRLATFLDYFYAGLEDEGTGGIHPTVQMLVKSAVLKGLQLVKLRKDKLYVGGTAHLGKAEAEVLKAWEEYARVQEWGTSRGSSVDLNGQVIDILPTWIASDTIASFSIDALATGPLEPLLSLLTESFSQLFSSGHLFASLASDLVSTPAGLHWNNPSPSHHLLSSIVESPLFQALGPLSRAMGRCIEAAGRDKSERTITAVRDTIQTCESLSKRIQHGWSRSKWCDIVDEEELDADTKLMSLPWTILKSYLFSLTLVQSALLIILSPLPGIPPTVLQLELAGQSLRILSLTYFITIKFGSEGFGAWRGVWHGLIETVRLDDEVVAKLMIELEPRERHLHTATVDRSIATFYLNAAEQLMKHFSSSYVEGSVLQICHPYLIDPKYRDSFESAHSVLLSIYANDKECANELSPWYSTLLLQAYPDLMSASQLRLAFTTMIRCVSNSDDALAWYCLLQLIAAIKAIPAASSTSSSLSVPSPSSESTSSSSALISTTDATDLADDASIPREFDEESTTTRLDEAIVLSPTESAALTLQRGHLLLTLIDQATSVNLSLFRTLLAQIWEFVKEEESGEGKNALVKVIFSTLGEGLDATKREEGVRFWMEKRSELE